MRSTAEYFVQKQVGEGQYSELSEYGRRRLLTYADSFRELAKSMEGSFTVDGQEDRAEVLKARRLWENQQVLSTNLNEMARIMTRVASEIFRVRPFEEKKKRVIARAFRSEGIILTDLYYIDRVGERTAVGAAMHSSAKKCHSSAQVADMLSVILDKRMEISVASPGMVEAESHNFVFVEEATFVVLTGTARAVKEGEVKSGDNHAVIESERGRLTAILSDGMGSGEKAYGDSEMVLDLMEKMLEAGYPVEEAVKLINGALIAGAERRNMSTMDICDLDLYDGNCTFLKAGAAASFLKRANLVETIENHSLPMGIFQLNEPERITRKLMDGDYIIMMTDGVLDALKQNHYEETMRQIVASVNEQNPKEIARRILQFVLHCSGGHVEDDMTVLVLGIWENCCGN